MKSALDREMLADQLYERTAGSTLVSLSCVRSYYSNMAPGTVKRFLECCACQIFNNDISFTSTSTSTSTFVTLVKSVQKSHQPTRAQSEKTV